jgi:hypothetical protein
MKERILGLLETLRFWKRACMPSLVVNEEKRLEGLLSIERSKQQSQARWGGGVWLKQRE